MSERFSKGGYIPGEMNHWPLIRRGNLYSETGKDGTWFRIISAEEIRALSAPQSEDAAVSPDAVTPCP